MPVLDNIACPAGSAAGFVIPLFKRHPGANLRMVQQLDPSDLVVGFEDIAGDDWCLKPTTLAVTVEIGDPAVWAFVDATGGFHVGTRDELAKRASELLSDRLIKLWPASAADLIRLCDLEFAFPRQTRRAYKSMVDLLGAGAAIWRDTDLILPLVRQRLDKLPDRRGARRRALSDVWANTIGDVCHIYIPEYLLGKNGPDLSSVAQIASMWGIDRLEVHPQSADHTVRSAPATTWPVVGHGGVGRWTVRRMWNAAGPFYNANIRARMGGNALEGLLAVSGCRDASMPPAVKIVIHGSAPANVAAGVELLGPKLPGVLQHVVNIRPIGTNPERKQFIPARSIVESREGPDYVWVIANHRPRGASAYYDGLARSQSASRYARAGVTALADLCRSVHGKTILEETESTHALGLVGATRFLAEMDMPSLLLRVIYSMLSPEWTFAGSKRIVCLWPRPLPDGSAHEVQIGNHRYRVQLIGVEQPSARADIRCLAFDVSERHAGVVPYADYLASVMAAWDWNLRSELGREMVFEEQGAVISMHIADTRASLDQMLERKRCAGPIVDVVVTNRRLTPSQLARAKASEWLVIHHSALPEWLQREFGEPGQRPAGGRALPVE
jgi:hypothetical protein